MHEFDRDDMEDYWQKWLERLSLFKSLPSAWFMMTPYIYTKHWKMTLFALSIPWIWLRVGHFNRPGPEISYFIAILAWKFVTFFNYTSELQAPNSSLLMVSDALKLSNSWLLKRRIKCKMNFCSSRLLGFKTLYLIFRTETRTLSNF